MGPGTDIIHTINYEDVMDDFDEFGSVADGMDPPTNGDVNDNTTARTVRQLPLKFFRRKLVEHFDILFHHNQIRWTIR